MNENFTLDDVFAIVTNEELQITETKKSRQAFRDYCYLGVARSLGKLFDRYQARSKDDPVAPTRRYATLTDWSRFFNWQVRVQLFDDIMEAEEESKWMERRKEIREKDFQMAQKLRDLAEGVLDQSPSFFTTRKSVSDPGTPAVIKITVDANGNELSRETVSKGTPRREINTVAIRTKDAIDASNAASKLARLSSEMETDRHTINVSHDTIGVEIVVQDLTQSEETE